MLIAGTLAGNNGNGYTKARPLGINDLGQVVGNSTIGKLLFAIPCLHLCRIVRDIYDLNNLIVPGNGVVLESSNCSASTTKVKSLPMDLTTMETEFAAFLLLTPINAVPEPSGLLLTGIGGLFVFGAWKALWILDRRTPDGARAMRNGR